MARNLECQFCGGELPDGAVRFCDFNCEYNWARQQAERNTSIDGTELATYPIVTPPTMRYHGVWGCAPRRR
jgi:hypothetical protein